jgi:hypothetical protein
MGASDEAQRQLRELERVVEYLERMNLRDVTAVPSDVTAILVAAGLTDMSDLRPSALGHVARGGVNPFVRLGH